VTTERSFIGTAEDLIETVKAIARQFQADEVFIVGSQSIFIEAYHAVRPLDPMLIEDRIRATELEAEVLERALAFIHRLTRAVS
jgi:hypothetical protein